MGRWCCRRSSSGPALIQRRPRAASSGYGRGAGNPAAGAPRDSVAGLLQRGQEVLGRFDAAKALVMVQEFVKLGLGLWGETDHALSAARLSCSFRLAFIRAMLARSRSRTGSRGTV